MYSSISDDVPGNPTRRPVEAQTLRVVGDPIVFVPGTGGMVRSVTVVLSSFACERGTWSGGDCVSSKQATFSHQIALSLYANRASAPGKTIASSSRAFRIPYRPSASPNCTGVDAGKWWDAEDQACYTGVATEVTFDFPSPGVNVPNTVVWGVAFNTTHYGALPIGEGAPCYSKPAGCAYDALNVGAQTLSLVGPGADPDAAHVRAANGKAHCDDGAGGTGIFRLDGAALCWTNFRPLAEFIGAGEKDCATNGWRQFTTPPFASERACTDFFGQF